MANLQAVVFDLYGTLIYLSKETKPYSRLLTNLSLTSLELKQAKKIALTNNFDNLMDFVKIIKPNFQIKLESYEQEIEEERASALVYPETLDVLNRLKEKNINLSLISNLASPYKKPFFDLRLNNYFNEIIFSCDVGLVKPDRKIYEKMINSLRIDPSKVLMTGDKVHADVDGPKSIGMNAIHLDRKNNSQNSIYSLEGIFGYQGRI